MNRWVDKLADEDIQFIKRFILASGSLKELATVYGVTYPTIRLRLDRLIERMKLLDNEETADEFERILRLQYADGRLDVAAFEALLKAHRDVMDKQRTE